MDKPPTKKQFLQNLDEKINEPEFTGDIYGLLRPEIEYDNTSAYNIIRTMLVDKI